MKRKLLYWWHRISGAECWEEEIKYCEGCDPQWGSACSYFVARWCAKNSPSCTGRIRYRPDANPKRRIIEDGRP